MGSVFAVGTDLRRRREQAHAPGARLPVHRHERQDGHPDGELELDHRQDGARL
ncbi:hypothetical protein BN1708_020600 [Verticillium longisporum]|uniref:Uncharacterized protein n=1 Tax=Verticillium longisporum TaxID=100787 RepID=A0A0G4MY13_VERLO|nr:hypothetical protein BN1708_020600 [Verticillium longisporum]